MGGAGIDAGDLDAWLAPFLEVLRRKTRRRWAPVYLRGLLGPGGRKSLQPLAASSGANGGGALSTRLSTTWAVLGWS